MKKRVFSGVQPSGTLHLGNYFGAIKQHIEMQANYDCIYFIADLHALTTVRDAAAMQANIRHVVAAYLALGLDPEKTIFFQQSAVPSHAELAWILDCIAPLGLIERAHAFKDAQAKGKKEITLGLFNYPVLMAADILLYKPDLVPVGKDQKQHIEITRDLATTFNHHFGETFNQPAELIKEEVANVPGTDGEKMSKSYGNTIDMLTDEKTLKSQIMSIVTDSTPLEEPKDPETCNVFKLYKLLASPDQTAEIAGKYRAGGFGYGHAKTALLELVLDQFSEARAKYVEIEKDPSYLEKVLADGAAKANALAEETMKVVKERVGLID